MLVIRESQLQHLAQARRAQFTAQRCVHAQAHHPQLCRFVGAAAVHQAVEAGIAAAMQRGLCGRVEVSLYLELVFLLGSACAHDPRLSQLAPLLAPDATAPPLFRARRAVDAAMHWLDDSHGPENTHLLRGLLRVRALSPSALAQPAEVAALVAWLTQLLPQQAAACGAAAMAALAGAALARAAGYGMQAPGDAAVIALHAFLLGSGFDQDPLVPWAGPVLTAGGPGRAERLFAASLQYLDAVLH